MRKGLHFLIIYSLSFCLWQNVQSQTLDSSSFSILPRLSFYSYEKEGEFLFQIPTALLRNHLSVTLKIGEESITTWNVIPGRNILRLPISLNMKPAHYDTEARITVA